MNLSSVSRLAVVASTGLFLGAMLTRSAYADKGLISSGPVKIKISHGDEPGTSKGSVAKLRIFCPSVGQVAPPQITMSFDIFTESDDPRVPAVHFHLSGLGKPAPGHLTTWRIDQIGSRLALMIDGTMVDKVDSPVIARQQEFVFCFGSSPFDTSLYPYGSWTASFQADEKLDPILILVPYPAPPLPVPIPSK